MVLKKRLKINVGLPIEFVKSIDFVRRTLKFRLADGVAPSSHPRFIITDKSTLVSSNFRDYSACFTLICFSY